MRGARDPGTAGTPDAVAELAAPAPPTAGIDGLEAVDAAAAGTETARIARMLSRTALIASSEGDDCTQRTTCSSAETTPHRSQEKVFTFLCELQSEIVDKHLRPGKSGRDVYQAARDYVQKSKPDLGEHFVTTSKTFRITEFKDSKHETGLRGPSDPNRESASAVTRVELQL